MHVFMLALIILDDRYTLPSLASAQCTRNYVHDVHELRFLVQLKQSILSIPSCRFQTSHTSDLKVVSVSGFLHELKVDKRCYIQVILTLVISLVVCIM